jgi:hypothetical protein
MSTQHVAFWDLSAYWLALRPGVLSGMTSLCLREREKVGEIGFNLCFVVELPSSFGQEQCDNAFSRWQCYYLGVR